MRKKNGKSNKKKKDKDIFCLFFFIDKMSILSCPDDKIRNPITKRCVLKNGKIGKKIIKKVCSDDKILNPKTKRCVLKSGRIGRDIMSLMNSEDNNIININIKNEKNSCYLDSLLVALFNFKNKEIYDLFFNSIINDFNNKKLKELGNLIKKELLNIYSFINKSTNDFIYCSLLRKHLQDYYNIYIQLFPKEKILYSSNDNWIDTQNDVYELLNLLSIIFNFKSKKMIKILDGDNKIYSNFIIEIPAYELFRKKNINIEDIFPLKIETYNLDDNNKFINPKGELVNNYDKKREYIKTKSFIYFQIYRNIGSHDKLKTSINYPEEIKIKENLKNLKIKSLIIHLGDSTNYGHYITLIKRKDIWYKYDDMESSISKISNYKINKYKKNIVGLLYSY